MILLNFAHPITEAQRAQIEALTGQPLDAVRNIPVQFDTTRSFAGQAMELANAAGLSPADWQTLPLLINPPSHALIAAVLLAELHGRMGYFPAVLRLRPVAGSLPLSFELAEIINLQAVRDQARHARTENGGEA